MDELIGVIVIEDGRFWAGVEANGIISIPGRFSKFIPERTDDIFGGMGVILTEGPTFGRSDLRIVSESAAECSTPSIW